MDVGDTVRVSLILIRPFIILDVVLLFILRTQITYV